MAEFLGIAPKTCKLRAVNKADLIVLVWLALAAVSGFRRGLTALVLSIGGLVAGAYAGSELGPQFLSGGSESPWVPIASLVGALIGALVLQLLAGLVGGMVRSLIPPGPLKTADSTGGIVVGTVTGVAIAWVVAVVALNQPVIGLQRHVESSAILSTIVDRVPPRTVLSAINSLDPLSMLSGLRDFRLPEPDPGLVQTRATLRATDSVVKILGTACGLGVQGSGWVIEPELVATNAHVASGQDDPRIVAPNGQRLRGTIVYLDIGNDMALLRVPGLRVPALPLSAENPVRDAVVMIGYPGGGAVHREPGTAGRPIKVIAPDATNRSAGFRTVVPLRGAVRAGDSGGPVINAAGEVVAMMFGATREGVGGVGVALDEIRRGLDSPLTPVPPGACL